MLMDNNTYTPDTPTEGFGDIGKGVGGKLFKDFKHLVNSLQLQVISTFSEKLLNKNNLATFVKNDVKCTNHYIATSKNIVTRDKSVNILENVDWRLGG